MLTKLVCTNQECVLYEESALTRVLTKQVALCIAACRDEHNVKHCMNVT